MYLGTSLEKAMSRFAEMADMTLEALTFSYAGRRIRPADTPVTLGIAEAFAEAVDDGDDPAGFGVQIDVSA